MDAMDVLGALLGKKSGSGSIGGKILQDMLGRATSRSQPSSGAHHPSRGPSRHRTPQSRRPSSIKDAAMGLEELLGVSKSHHQSRRGSTTQDSPPPSQPPAWSPEQKQALDAQAMVLIRAMICAAKSDGQITRDEQDAIVKQLEHVGDAEIKFLREEFKRPVDVRELAWSVPLGMEEPAYRLSLIAIDLDEQKEAEYLADLAHGLRIPPQRCNEIHQQLGAPAIFR